MMQHAKAPTPRELLQATREGRRREFARFAAYGSPVPDPQDPGTFTASKLTREEDPELKALYGELLRLRRMLPGGEADVAFDEDERWLRVRRGEWHILCNFAAGERLVPCEGAEVVLATHPPAPLADGGVRLAALAGAVVR